MMPAFKFDIDPENKFLNEFVGVGTVTAGVVSYGDAAAYALVWEFGNVRQWKKGPKTTLGVNLLTGEHVWLSIQAPTGYIRVNELQYWSIMEKCFNELTLQGSTPGEIKKELEAAAYKAAKLIAEVIRETAPEDSGDLKASILAVPPGDDFLDLEETFEGATLEVEYSPEEI